MPFGKKKHAFDSMWVGASARIRGKDLGLRVEEGQPFLDLEVETVTFGSQGETVNTSREPLRRPVG